VEGHGKRGVKRGGEREGRGERGDRGREVKELGWEGKYTVSRIFFPNIGCAIYL